jgi:hypothetical protein
MNVAASASARRACEYLRVGFKIFMVTPSRNYLNLKITAGRRPPPSVFATALNTNFLDARDDATVEKLHGAGGDVVLAPDPLAG